MNAIVDTRMRLLGCFPLNTILIQTHILFNYKQLSNRIVHNNRILRRVSTPPSLLSRSLDTGNTTCQTTTCFNS
jgi:hypothetical protein